MIFLYKLSALYSRFLKLLGYERGIGRFIDALELDCPEDARILDLGCGSGVVGLRLLERFPKATLLATDIEPNFLKAMLENARERGIDTARINTGVADISDPEQVTLLDGTRVTLDPVSFDIVSVGGVLAYSKNTPDSARRLLTLIRPGGYLVNLEMNERPIGRFVAWIYSYRPMPMNDMRDLVEGRGHAFSTIPFSLADFPANLTRVGIISRVRPPQDPAETPANAAEAAPLYSGQSDYKYST